LRMAAGMRLFSSVWLRWQMPRRRAFQLLEQTFQRQAHITSCGRGPNVQNDLWFWCLKTGCRRNFWIPKLAKLIVKNASKQPFVGYAVLVRVCFLSPLASTGTKVRNRQKAPTIAPPLDSAAQRSHQYTSW